MENLDLELNVGVNTQQAEQGLDSLKQKANETANAVGDIGKKSGGDVSSIKGLDNAFEELFKVVSKGGKNTSSSLKAIFDSVKGAIPLVKNLNRTALAGIKGINAALISTGIGAVVTILGMIVSHWEDIVRLTGIGREAQERYTAAVEASVKRMDDLNWEHEKEVRLLKARGAGEEEIAEAKVEQAEETWKAQTAEDQLLISMAATRREAEKLRKEASERWKEGKKNVENAKKEEELVKEEIKLRKQHERELEAQRKAAAKNQQALDAQNKALEESAAKLKELKENAKDVSEVMLAIAHGDIPDASEDSVNYFKRLLSPEAARAASGEVIEELKKAGININQAIINGLLEGDAQEYNNKLQELVSQRHLLYASGYKSVSEDLKSELEIQKEAYANEEALLNKRMEFILKYIGEGPEYKDLESQLVVLGDEREAFVREQTRKIAEAALDEQMTVLDQESDLMDFNVGVDLKKWKDNWHNRLVAYQEYYRQMMNSYDEGSEEYKKYAKLYQQITDQLNSTDEGRTQAMMAHLDQQYEYWDKLISQISSTLGSIGDMYEENSRLIKENAEREYEAGNLKEEAYKKELERSKKQFDRAKQLQIATTIINTLAGAIGAFLQASAAYPPPYGQILGATSAAAVTAAGLAEIQSIKNKNFDSTSLDGLDGGGASNMVGVTPIQVGEDIQPSPTVLSDSQTSKNQRVYILQADLEDSHRQVQIREDNSTF